MLLENRSFFEKKRYYITAAFIIVSASVYSAVGYPHSLSFLIISVLAVVSLLSYKLFIGSFLALIMIIPEGDFILHIGLGLKFGKGFTIHPMDLLFGFTLFIFLLRQVLSQNHGLHYPKLISSVILFFFLISLIEFIRGIPVNGFKNAAWDARYAFYFITFFITYEIFYSEHNILKIIKILLLSLACYGIFITILSLIRETDLVPAEIWKMWFPSSEMKYTGRMAAANTDVFTILIPLMLFFKDLVQSKRILSKFQWWFVFLSYVVATLIGMGRTQLFFIFMNIIILLFVRPKYTFKVLVSLVIFILMMVLLLSVSTHAYSILNGVIERITDLEYLHTSLIGRYLSFYNALNMFLAKPIIGTGFGSVMNLINFAGTIGNDGLFIDNAFATIFAKTGIIGGFPFVFLSLMPFFILPNLIKHTADQEVKNIYISIFLVFPSFWFVSTMSSAHLIHSRINILFFSVLLAILCMGYLNNRYIYAKNK
jgi:O-antigen ligase